MIRKLTFISYVSRPNILIKTIGKLIKSNYEQKLRSLLISFLSLNTFTFNSGLLSDLFGQLVFNA